MRNCASKKIGFSSYSQAVSALLETHQKTKYPSGQGPQNVYKCSVCDEYHLTSSGNTLPELRKFLHSKNQNSQQNTERWIQKFKDY